MKQKHSSHRLWMRNRLKWWPELNHYRKSFFLQAVREGCYGISGVRAGRWFYCMADMDRGCIGSAIFRLWLAGFPCLQLLCPGSAIQMTLRRRRRWKISQRSYLPESIAFYLRESSFTCSAFLSAALSADWLPPCRGTGCFRIRSRALGGWALGAILWNRSGTGEKPKRRKNVCRLTDATLKF